ncbi:HigA family addiction module antitoxin [Faecalibaculum rodentium]|uniref:HigA family addiction module antitoxin n=1 Tax=Faecalibaculum rodentium TaxID=1702221 RepID=UPI00266E9460|nr:HigA family addiction module antitoxin [Faecalibaculum rodentium]
MESSKTYIAFQPGYYLQEYIEDREISEEELAEKMNVSVQYIKDLINGDAPMTRETSVKLECALGLSSGYWLRLEKGYQKRLKLVREENELEKREKPQ